MRSPTRLDLFVAPACARCHGLQERIAAVAREFGEGRVVLHVVDLGRELEYAADLGVRSFPALAVNGALLFPTVRRGPRFEGALREALARTIAGETASAAG